MRIKGSVAPAALTAPGVFGAGQSFFEASGKLKALARSAFDPAVVEAFEGRSEEIKEHRIGVKVFGRNSLYDQRNDSIVRVEASRLREKQNGHLTCALEA